MKTIKEIEKERASCPYNCNFCQTRSTAQIEILQEVLELIDGIEYDSNERSVVDYHELKSAILGRKANND